MTRILFRSNANNSKIFLTTLFDHESVPVILQKSSTNPLAIAKLRNEIAGVLWYEKISGIKLLNGLTELPNYYALKLNFFHGQKGDFRKGYWKNRKIIEKAIEVYCNIWSSLGNESGVIHGDYSIDNLIVCGDDLIIIDWEHYTQGSFPIGFDALNLIYEQIYISLLSKPIEDRVIEHSKSMLLKLKSSNAIDRIFYQNPLGSMKKLFSDNSNIWGDQLNKLPIMSYSHSQCKNIDSIINLIEH